MDPIRLQNADLVLILALSLGGALLLAMRFGPKLARHRGRSARGKPRGHCGRDRVRIIDVLSVPVRRPRPPPAHIAATRRGCSTAPVG